MTDHFHFQDLVDHMEEARQEGYGHAYLTVSFEEELTWGMCGGKATFSEEHSTTWVSPFVQGEKTTKARHQDAWAWLQDIKAGLGVLAFEKLYEPVTRAS